MAGQIGETDEEETIMDLFDARPVKIRERKRHEIKDKKAQKKA